MHEPVNNIFSVSEFLSYCVNYNTQKNKTFLYILLKVYMSSDGIYKSVVFCLLIMIQKSHMPPTLSQHKHEQILNKSYKKRRFLTYKFSSTFQKPTEHHTQATLWK